MRRRSADGVQPESLRDHSHPGRGTIAICLEDHSGRASRPMTSRELRQRRFARRDFHICVAYY
jgi:hypothetical protein